MRWSCCSTSRKTLGCIKSDQHQVRFPMFEASLKCSFILLWMIFARCEEFLFCLRMLGIYFLNDWFVKRFGRFRLVERYTMPREKRERERKKKRETDWIVKVNTKLSLLTATDNSDNARRKIGTTFWKCKQTNEWWRQRHSNSHWTFASSDNSWSRYRRTRTHHYHNTILLLHFHNNSQYHTITHKRYLITTHFLFHLSKMSFRNLN
jgi:hypothetical protein